MMMLKYQLQRNEEDILLVINFGGSLKYRDIDFLASYEIQNSNNKI